MHNLEVLFRSEHDQTLDLDQVSHAINSLLGAWRMNGQVAGGEWGIYQQGTGYSTVVMSPEQGALNDAHDNRYVRRAKHELSTIGLTVLPRSLGEDIEGLPLCSCSMRTGYILYTSYLSLESALRCYQCFNPIPLYHLPKTYDDEYYDIICWQSNYQACDRLFMNSQVLEQASHRELFRFDSTLSQQGYAICRRIETLTGLKAYYFLKKHSGRSLRQEQQRLCPGCGQQWRLEECWHLFDFRCERCQLLSNISWSVA